MNILTRVNSMAKMGLSHAQFNTYISKVRGDFALDARMQRAARIAEEANVHSQHQWQHGRAFRIVQPGAECVIRLGMSGGREAAVCVTPQNVLDDCARFAEQNRKKRKYIVNIVQFRHI